VSEEGSGAEARAAFARFKGLAGRWQGRSTRGWTDTSTIRVIAGGSVVEMASFDAHPGEEMRTLFHLDGDRHLVGAEKLSSAEYLLGEGAPEGTVGPVLSGNFMIAAADADEALRLARGCPHLRYGGRLAVRPIETLPAEG
jgi:hypothetical protein